MTHKFPMFDLRDGAHHASYQLNSRKLVNVPWYWPERSLSGFHNGHDDAMARLIRSCKKDKQKVHAAFVHNYAVSVIIEPTGE